MICVRPGDRQSAGRREAEERQCDDERYLAGVENGLRAMVAAASPDIAVYLAGADPYEDDVLGGLAVTMQGLHERDELVLTACSEHGMPVAVVLAGGYARNTQDTVAIHCATAREVKRVVEARGQV